MTSLSPLRYPGGKGSFTNFFGGVLKSNHLEGGLYAEPFAGGGGAAVGLLFGGHVDRIAINDADPRVYAFWNSALHNTKLFLQRIENTPLTIYEWEKQRQVYLKPKGRTELAVGFAAFYLNRCNRSGIMVNGGPIGGKHQSGEWKLDARFNRADLAGRIIRLAEYKDRILLSGDDASAFIERIPKLAGDDPSLVYLDPPYFEKGRQLYMNHFVPEDHRRLATQMRKQSINWLMTYDDHPEIRAFYDWANCRSFSLKYSVYEPRFGGEVLIWPEWIQVPQVHGTSKFVEC